MISLALIAAAYLAPVLVLHFTSLHYSRGTRYAIADMTSLCNERDALRAELETAERVATKFRSLAAGYKRTPQARILVILDIARQDDMANAVRAKIDPAQCQFSIWTPSSGFDRLRGLEFDIVIDGYLGRQRRVHDEEEWRMAYQYLRRQSTRWIEL